MSDSGDDRAGSRAMAFMYMEQIMGRDLSRMRPVRISGWRVAEILWPLNGLFKADYHRVASLPYDPGFGPEVDAAIIGAAESGSLGALEGLSPGGKRVLLERHQQMLLVALANEAAGESVGSIPEGLPAEAELPLLMLLYLHEMGLPFESEDRSQSQWPGGFPPASLRPS